MVIQYPHHLLVKVTPASVQGSDGFWSDGVTLHQYLGVCREETAGAGSEVQIADGTYRRFSSLVQLPRGFAYIPEGTEVLIAEHMDGRGVRLEGVVLKFDRGQLHARLWVGGAPLDR